MAATGEPAKEQQDLLLNYSDDIVMDDLNTTGSEAHKMLQIVSDCIGDLYKLSILVRNASPRDHFTKALTSNRDDPFIDQFDIAHVGHKFPRLDTDKNRWLKIRLGKAITQRRQFLLYCRSHHARLSTVEPERQYTTSHSNSEVISKAELKPSKSNKTTEPRSAISDQASGLNPTIASTLNVSDLQSLETSTEDAISRTTFATTVGEGADINRLQVESLTDISKNKHPFQCPYCWDIVDIKRQNIWK